jgi:hypothetical protein
MESANQFVLLPSIIQNRIQSVADEGSDCVGTSNDGAELNQKLADAAVMRSNRYPDSSDLIVEVYGRHLFFG